MYGNKCNESKFLDLVKKHELGEPSVLSESQARIIELI